MNYLDNQKDMTTPIISRRKHKMEIIVDSHKKGKEHITKLLTDRKQLHQGSVTKRSSSKLNQIKQ